MKNLIFFALISLSISACSQNKDYAYENDIAIQKYLKANDLKAQKSLSGLYFIIDETGNDKKPKATSRVTVAYKGSFINGDVFDESNEEGINFGLNQVIKGWTEGITYFGEGGKGTLLVPAHLGYGSKRNRSIPGGSVLIFDIKLIKVH